MAANESTPLGPAAPLVRAAVELGGRAAAAGDASGAHDLYACAARLVRQVRGLSEVADFRLERALDESDDQEDPASSAALLRKAFDALLPDEEPAPVPEDPLEATQWFIEMAISIGAPAYNLDDRQGCFDVYSCTARMILATMSAPEPAQQRLRQALDECARLSDPNKQAWAMRHGFDAVLGLGGKSGPALSPEQVLQLLARAISIGAPAYNLGDNRGCYEVYACTARLIVHSGSVDDNIKEHLRQALVEAAVIPDVDRQAWVMRHAFDALLDAARASGEEDDDEDDDEDDEDDEVDQDDEE
ncbi:MAG: hypothetical protein AB7K24_15395 [Gemmataceae bacterium]